MGMSLSGVGGYFSFSQRSWCYVLEMAYRCGWKPAGTVYSPSLWLVENRLDEEHLSPDDAAFLEKRKADWDCAKQPARGGCG
jgi:hypothetical protein